MIYGIFSIVLASVYAIILQSYRYYWKRIPIFEWPETFQPRIFLSIIIPARNEADNIDACLAALATQTYPAHLFEIIVVDDHSVDGTAEVAVSHKIAHLKVLKLGQNEEGKKAALSLGIAQAGGELIVTTDADCIVPANWLMYIAAFYEKTEAKFIAGPVIFHKEKSLFERFQSLDFMGMMLITGAGIKGRFMHSSNGANLAYPKKVYRELNGFEGADHIASGDDILFMQKVAKKYPGKLFFLKNPQAAVKTRAMPDLRSFINQRIRWGTKSAQYSEWKITAILAVVFFFCWNIVLAGVGTILDIGGWRYIGVIFVFQLLIKSWADYYFLREASRFFGKARLMKSFWPAQVMHINYIALVGLLANLKKRYQWKGRKTR